MIVLSTNLKTNKATTQFTNYNFSSFCNFNGKSLAANDKGLFELGGSSDNGIPINAYFEPVTSNWGSMNPKRCRFFYIGYQAADRIKLSIGNSFKAIIAPPEPNVQSRARITIPRDIVHTYWSYRFSNINGCDFSIDSIDVLPIRRSHGHSNYS